MPDKDKDTKVDVGETVAAALEAYDARQTARREKEEADALAKKAMEEKLEAGIREKVEAEFEEEKKAWAKAHGVASIKKLTELGGDNDGIKSFDHYVRTGDETVAKKALQEDTAGEGGYLVPDQLNAEIIALRDPISFPRKMGVQVMTAGGDKLDMPTESTAFTKFVRTAEEGAYDENDPAFAQNQITIHKWTKLLKISEELLDDDQCDLLGWMKGAIARAAALTEAYYVAIGSGSNQHEGIFTGGDTDALTFASGTASTGWLTPAEVSKLLYTLGEGYHDGAAWLMDPLTEQVIMTLDKTNDWSFGAADNMYFDKAKGLWVLYGKPIYKQDNIDVGAASVCFLMVGHPWYYALAERKMMSMRRLNELYAANGQVGFIWNFRQGGKVLVETAWVGGVANAT